MAKKLLKDYVSDDSFIEKMNRAFSDLRADYELSMDADQVKIDELQKTHVDVKNQLSDLSSYSLSSSGVVSGLRGTGKTHLLLLARNNINTNCFTKQGNGIFCIYLNVKRLNFPQDCNQEIFNRIISVYIYSELSKQLQTTLTSLKDKSFIEKLLGHFNNDKKKLVKNLQGAISKLIEFNEIVRNGNSEFKRLSIGSMEEEFDSHSLMELAASWEAMLSLKDAELKSTWSSKYSEEISNKISTNNTYLNYLTTNTIREEIISLLKLVGLNGITFYVDEWEKISYSPKLQEYLSFFIDRIIDDPIYFWISFVPYRGKLYYLDNGADLQHFIDLDDNLVYENSTRDRELCLNYFRTFVDNRLRYYFHDEIINVGLLFNNNRNFEKLVLSSMGNSRDFGTMLLKCWSEYRAYRTNTLAPGRPFQYISEKMVIGAIKNNGEKKMSNIQNDTNTLSVWNNVETFCLTRKSSHFAIEENRENIENLARLEFSNLIYHRLIHLRKRHVPAKDSSTESKLAIYALDYSSSYDLHANDKRIQYITDYDTVHDRVRRYIYTPSQIINRLKIQDGEIFLCSSCNESINIVKMTAAWESNNCPYCGSQIRMNIDL